MLVTWQSITCEHRHSSIYLDQKVRNSNPYFIVVELGKKKNLYHLAILCANWSVTLTPILSQSMNCCIDGWFSKSLKGPNSNIYIYIYTIGNLPPLLFKYIKISNKRHIVNHIGLELKLRATKTTTSNDIIN